MPPFPLPLVDLIGKAGEFAVYLAIGFGFGYALEISGFANSPKLAAQFYFRELTVLKVMFTAIVTAMVLVFASSAVGLLDYNLVWVNPTYLWPGIVGGLIMGIGFILGGFCPGTSLVAVATAKLDGIFFTLGGLFGIFLFGETVGLYDIFWNSSYMGRFTLDEWLGLPTGVVVVLVVLMALFMFWGAEQLERRFGGLDPRRAPKLRYAGGGALLAGAVLVLFVGQPTNTDRWNRIAAEKEMQLNDRAVYVHPGEVLANMHDHKLKLVFLDVRPEADYNLFHLTDARRVEPGSLENPSGLEELAKELQTVPANTVFILMSNGETAATEAWKVLSAESVPNLYILEGGVNNWLAHFAGGDPHISLAPGVDSDHPNPCAWLRGGATPLEQPALLDPLCFEFSVAAGARYPAAYPDPSHFKLQYIPKIELQLQRGPGGGGCG
jgi:rhodanese-related sulfurtransferase/uncharacterized membrane protein (DUF485 family)